MHEALHLRGLGGVLAAEPEWTFSDDNQILCQDGRIVAIGDAVQARARSLKQQGVPVRVLNGDGLVALPGLIDGHVHPVAGSTSVVPAGSDWTHCYLNAGVTACVSAGELTVPGFRARDATPDAVTRLATTSAWCFGNIAAPPRVFAGTLLAVPGLEERHIAEVAAAGGRCLKYIYYPFGKDMWREEVERYRHWARAHGLVTKLHAGGTSFQGDSVAATGTIVTEVAPDLFAHANGGPIPLSDTETMAVIEKTNAFIEVIPGGNLRLLGKIARTLRERGELGRLTVGTDSPGGNGIVPRGPLQAIAAISALGEVDAATALRCGTDNVARSHRIPGGGIRTGEPANILLSGPVQGSSHRTISAAIESGELIGIGAVIYEGDVVALPARFTPPPKALPAWAEVTP
jgi:enamidase